MTNTFPAAEIRKHLARLIRHGIDIDHIAYLTGMDVCHIENALDRTETTVPFWVADRLYDVTTADRPLYHKMDSSRAYKILEILASANDMSLEEAGQLVSMPCECLQNTLNGKPITLGAWQNLSERGKKRGVRLSDL